MRQHLRFWLWPQLERPHSGPTEQSVPQVIRGLERRVLSCVAEREGAALGYAYAGPFHQRAAYSRCCELSIYLSPAAQKQGLGRRLYEALEARLRDMGFLNLYACIGYPEEEDEYLTRNSAEFHAHLGFRKVGEFHLCGYKFGRWYHMIWMEKLVGEHNSSFSKIY